MLALIEVLVLASTLALVLALSLTDVLFSNALKLSESLIDVLITALTTADSLALVL